MIIETITKDKTVRVQNYISPDNIIFTEFHLKFCNHFSILLKIEYKKSFVFEPLL